MAHARGALARRAWQDPSIDAAAALALPGVHAVWTAADVAHIPPIDFRLTGLEALEPYRQPVLAKDSVRYVGEPVAVVFATIPISPRMPPSWSSSTSRSCRATLDRDRANRASSSTA